MALCSRGVFGGTLVLGGIVVFATLYFSSLLNAAEKEAPSKPEVWNGLTGNYTWEMESVDPMQIREYLKVLSERPHLAGSDRDQALVDWMVDTMRTFGLDSVRTESYKMLLDYPNSDNPNLIRVLGADGSEEFRSHYKEEGVDDPNFIHAFNAYSKAGTVTGVPVYVNYGSVEDFEWLNGTGTVDFKGKICVTRYGMVFRGNKAQNAADFGCAGLIIYSDPMEAACEGTEPEHVFPNDFWIPGTGVQRGSLALTDGDPLTPYWPSVENAYRLDAEDVKEFLPTIPVQPIGYSDAFEILKLLGGQEVPEEWKGQIPDLTYKIGGEFSQEYQGYQIELSVHNELVEKDSSNVIGVIYGAEEPDRYVMMGNHRDAWGFGAVDPSSGTAQMLEVARVLGEKLKMGWRPKRTIMFLSWGAEEYSLCGSREFVEEHQMEMEDRGVAYINTDVCMAGSYLEPAASPTMAHLFKSATKDIWSPDGNGSYYDFWSRYEETKENEEFEPEVTMSPGAGSDHATFIYLTGVPVLDIYFGPDHKKFPTMQGYPAYHTGYETFDLVDKIYDPEFLMFRACAQLNLRLSIEMADSDMIPLELETYADVMESAVADMGAMGGVFEKLADLGIETKHLINAVSQFRGAVVAWKEYVAAQDLDNVLTRRTINDQIRSFEKTFLLNPGLPDRLQYRHAIIAPSQFDAYGGSAFPGLGDLLHGIDSMDAEDRSVQIKKLKRHISDLMIVVQRAAAYLKPLSQIPDHSGTPSLTSMSLLSLIVLVLNFSL